MCIPVTWKKYKTALCLKTEQWATKKFLQSHHRVLKLRWHCYNASLLSQVYFSNGNCIKNTTFMANNLLELSQSYELSFNSGFSANMFSKSTLCVIVTGGELLELWFLSNRAKPKIHVYIY